MSGDASRIAEIVGAFIILAGCGAFVAAAGLVSTALAVCVAGFFLVLIGVIIVYVATLLSRSAGGTTDDAAR